MFPEPFRHPCFVPARKLQTITDQMSVAHQWQQRAPVPCAGHANREPAIGLHDGRLHIRHAGDALLTQAPTELFRGEADLRASGDVHLPVADEELGLAGDGPSERPAAPEKELRRHDDKRPDEEDYQELEHRDRWVVDHPAQHVVLDLVERGVEGEFAFPENVDLEDHHEHAQRELDDRQCIETHVSDSRSRRHCDQ